MAEHVPNLQPGGDLVVAMSPRMLSIRKSEEQLFRVVGPGRTPVQVHMSEGHGAVACDTCVRLDDRDPFASSHRGQGHDLAMGGDQITAGGQDVRFVERA